MGLLMTHALVSFQVSSWVSDNHSISAIHERHNTTQGVAGVRVHGQGGGAGVCEGERGQAVATEQTGGVEAHLLILRPSLCGLLVGRTTTTSVQICDVVYRGLPWRS